MDEILEPMPPPPAPSPHPRRVYSDPSDNSERLTPHSPPVPHAHPLVSLSDESARYVKTQVNSGGMAINSSQKLFRPRPIITGKRLDSTFLSHDRIKAFTDQKNRNLEPSENPLATETEFSSRIIALKLQEKTEQVSSVVIPLGEDEKILAATNASAKRHEIMKTEGKESENEIDDSALARASERKVRKQLNVKWVQSRQDPANRPKKPLERAEERHLRETLYRTTSHDMLRVLHDDADVAKAAAFSPMNRNPLPVMSGIVGLAGCCFEKYEY